MIDKEKEFGMKNFINHRLETIVTNKFKIHFYNSFTNLKIFMISSVGAKTVKNKLARVYEVYGNFLRNNATYSVELLDGTTNQITTV